MTKRKICVVVASRANYGRVKSLMKAIQNHSQLQLQLVVGASTLLERFGRAVNIIRQDGFEPERSLFYVVEGENLMAQAKTAGLGLIELSTAFADLAPDAVITVGDRYETMSTALAATYLNIPLIHLQGGEVSGNIDDRVRHAITKLADFHFTCSELSSKRVIAMGEESWRVFNYGCPAIDILTESNLSINNEMMLRYGGVGAPMNWEAPYILVLQHPVTTSYGNGFAEISATLEAVRSLSHIQKIVLWPNVDAGSDDISKGIRMFREQNPNDKFHYYRNFSPEDFARVLNNAACAVGNSSSFIREGSFLGLPAVIVGDRQADREHGANVVFVECISAQIEAATRAQLIARRYPSAKIFGDGGAGLKIADRISTLDLNLNKRHVDALGICSGG